MTQLANKLSYTAHQSRTIEAERNFRSQFGEEIDA